MNVNRRAPGFGVKSLRSSFMVTHDQQTAGVVASVLTNGTYYLLSYNSVVSLFFSPHIFLPMGRPSWATPEQLTFLHSYTSELPNAKAGTGLNIFYVRVAQDFLVHWSPEPVSSHATPPATPQELKDLAETRLHDVCFSFACVYPHH